MSTFRRSAIIVGLSVPECYFARVRFWHLADISTVAANVRFWGKTGHSEAAQPVQIWRTKVVRAHQPDEAVFRSILPEDIDWKPFAAFPPSVRLAILVGHPSEPGPYLIRVKVPSGVKLMPHRHPEDRIYTVMSGVFYIGLGDKFDGDRVKAYPPGSVIVLPGDTPHFHWAKSGEYVTQVSAVGPLGLEYLDSADDPRH
jgi:quercetin dioxygenase-like cupin family protein